MIIGKSGTTRKRIESETRSRINVPKQGASSDPKSNIPLEKEAFKQAFNPNQKSMKMKIPDLFSNTYFKLIFSLFFADFSSSIGIAWPMNEQFQSFL